MVVYPPDRALEELEHMPDPQQIGYLSYRALYPLEVGAGKTLLGSEKEQLGGWVTFVWRTQSAFHTGIISGMVMTSPSIGEETYGKAIPLEPTEEEFVTLYPIGPSSDWVHIKSPREETADSITLVAETLWNRGAIVNYGGFTLLSASASVAPSVEISYYNKEDIEDLLGSKGCQALYNVIELIKRSAVESTWPLVRVEVRHTRDVEARDWEYVLIALVFACSFETADRHLHEFYDRLDALTDELSDEEQTLLRRAIFFDIKVVSEIFSTGPY